MANGFQPVNLIGGLNLQTARPLGFSPVQTQSLVPDVGRAIQAGLQTGSIFEQNKARRLANQQAQQNDLLKNIGSAGQALSGVTDSIQAVDVLNQQRQQFADNPQVLAQLQEAEQLISTGNLEQVRNFGQQAFDLAQSRGLLKPIAKKPGLDKPFAVTKRLNEAGREETGFITQGGNFISIGETGRLTGAAKLKAEATAAAQKKKAELEAKAQTPEGLAKTEKAELEATKKREEIIQQSLQFDDAGTKIGRSIEALEDLLNQPGLSAAVGAKGITSLFGIADQPLAGTEAADFVTKLDTVKANQFLEAVEAMRGLGTLTEREGAKIESASGTLSPDQSEKAFINNANIVLRNLREAEKKIKQRSTDFNKRNREFLPTEQTGRGIGEGITADGQQPDIIETPADNLQGLSTEDLINQLSPEARAKLGF